MAKLSHRITSILGVRIQIENCVLTATDDADLTSMLEQIVKQILPDPSESKVITLSQCFMKDMSVQQEECDVRRKLYIKWINYIKGGRLK